MSDHSVDQRKTFTTQTTSRAEIRELLEGIFVSELLLSQASDHLLLSEASDHRTGGCTNLLAYKGTQTR